MGEVLKKNILGEVLKNEIAHQIPTNANFSKTCIVPKQFYNIYININWNGTIQTFQKLVLLSIINIKNLFGAIFQLTKGYTL